MAQILQESLIPTFVIDNNHIITHWNKACERLTGLAAGQMIGTDKQWRAFYPEESPVMADLIVDKVPNEVIARYFGDGVQIPLYVAGAYEAEGLFPESGQKDRWLFMTAAPLKDDQGKIIGAVETLQDITARKQVEAALIKTQEESERRVEKRTVELTSLNTDLKKEIAERMRVEEELRLSENKFRTVADFTYDWEYWIDPEGFLVYVSPSVERITGYGVKELNKYSDFITSITHPDDQEEVVRHLEEERNNAMVAHLDFRIITQNGEELWMSHFCQPVFDAEGNNLGRRVSNRDITKRKKMEVTLRKEREELEIRVKERTRELSSAYTCLLEEVESRKKAYKELQEREEDLRKRQEFIETILANLPIGLVVGTITGGRIQYMNSEFTQIYGWPKDVLGSFDAFFEHVYPDPKYRKVIKNRVMRDIATRDPSKMIWKNLLPTTESGEQRIVTVRGIPLFEQNLIILTTQDITEKHKAGEALQFTRFSIDHANDMIYWVAPDGKIVDVNKTTCVKLGCSREELLTMLVTDINPSITLDQFYEDWKNIKHHKTWRVETSHCCKSGEAIPVEIHTNHIEFGGKEYNCVFARDITERRELERLVAIQNKMGSLGRVAAGIAHEIRNPLSTINVYLSTVKRLLETEDFDMTNFTNLKEAVTEMDTASHKIETVVKRVMDFSKPSRHRMQFMDLNQCIRDALDLSAVTLRKSGVVLELKLDEDLPECYMDSQLIEQVMLNLITNAIEELIESHVKRQLEVTTEQRSNDGLERSIVITVADSGPGVPAELHDRIFDPFFTTKHYGSGIGLSICHRIISDHHGSLHVSTSKWGGAMFVAQIPVKREAGK
ncbi:MAG: PAS domain S-box-containing protein [Desulforhopalus sp.]|jgi:PAS domain S-box-containing protein